MPLFHPAYFPSIAQMVAMVQSHEIIFEVHDNYQKQTYRNRCYIAHSNGKLALNIPIQHAKDGKRQRTSEVCPDDSFPWQQQHWKSLQSAYRTSPFFEFYEDDLKPLFNTPVTNLMNHNLNIIKLVYNLLGLKLKYELTATYEKETPYKDFRNLIISKKEPDYDLEVYTQVLESHHGFLKNLSVLDVLFNEGPNALLYLERQKTALS